MSFEVNYISAKTHTPEYLMHKYWARKPHNVISQCIKKLLPDSGVIVDPFCGSGVVLREGARLNNRCYGFDVNPIACLISSVLINGPQKEKFVENFNKIYDSVLAKYGFLYETLEGFNVKYVSHRIIARCECAKILKYGECIKQGKKAVCPNCGKIVHFNLETMDSTEIFNVTIDKNKGYVADKDELFHQRQLSAFLDDEIDYAKYNFSFPENRRILAFDGIRTQSFFTNRNLTILCAFADEIHKIEDEKIKQCCLLLLSASVAQCSRLIAHRNNLSTGGPAWSVPGFWIPLEHLETNPFIHIKARLNKFIKALEYLEDNPAQGQAEICLGDSLKLLEGKYKDLKADLIFVDPPYGDNVPYTEFSNIWNSFLKNIPSFEEDISVSDRADKNESWKNYGEKLEMFMNCFAHHLNKEGKLLITFNNNDMRAWKALISALQKNKFVCKSVFNQIPAVISAKAQFSIDSSYVSDIYSVYVHDDKMQVSKDLSALITHLCHVANLRNGTLSKVVLDREFIISWLKYNIDNSLLASKEDLISSIFDYDKANKTYVLKAKYVQKMRTLREVVIENVCKIVKEGPISVMECYKKVCENCSKYSSIELGEFREYIKDFIIRNEIIYGSIKMTESKD